jgi:hypothetical protein
MCCSKVVVATVKFRHLIRLRRALVSLLSERDLVWVSRRLGHASVEITDRTYGHMLAGARRRLENRTLLEIVRAAATLTRGANETAESESKPAR